MLPPLGLHYELRFQARRPLRHRASAERGRRQRWALLSSCGSWSFGPKRYSDLHRGLPQMSQNVLAQRLRELEADGLVRRRRLGPPAPAAVYELTERGQELEPVLRALAHWGSRAPLPEDGAAELSVDALLFALRATFDPALAGELSLRCQLDVAGDSVPHHRCGRAPRVGPR